MTTHDSGPVVATENLLIDNPALYERTFPDAEGRNPRFVHDMVRRFGRPARDRPAPRLLDVGAGTGRDAARLAELGYTVAAVDISEQMVAYARSRHPGLQIAVGDARSVRTREPVDIVSCLGSTLLHLTTTADIVAALHRFAACLTPGGLLVAEMRNGAFLLTDRGRRELLDHDTVRVVEWEGVRYTSRTWLSIDLAGQLLRRRRTWSWPGGTHPIEQHTAWRLLFPQELRYLLDVAGFDVLALFDAPGPLTEPPWPAGEILSDTLDGDRLHLVARRRGPDLDANDADG
ncbi:methyltransferase domain-containing protein [Kribbella sp. NPDC050820]|uniref:class I SAM-dependent methyltransferase n=1 Tax=Kribbella sp. NPDC050820 TaxID=3155408 RepID=UPI00340BCECE